MWTSAEEHAAASIGVAITSANTVEGYSDIDIIVFGRFGLECHLIHWAVLEFLKGTANDEPVSRLSLFLMMRQHNLY